MSRYQQLLVEIKKLKPKSILEVGTWNGKHAKAMIKTAQKYVTNSKDIIYYGFDLFEDFIQQEEEHCEKPPAKIHDVANYLARTNAIIRLYKGNSKDTLTKFRPKTSIDFIFIDGGHSLKTIVSDWNNVKRLIHAQSVILFDDYYIEHEHIGCKVLLDTLSEHATWQVSELGKDVFATNIGKQTTCLMKVQFVS